jgi:hypothetical protein
MADQHRHITMVVQMETHGCGLLNGSGSRIPDSMKHGSLNTGSITAKNSQHGNSYLL